MLNIHIHRINPKHLAKASLDKERASARKRGAWEPIGDPCSQRACSSATVRGLRTTSCGWCSDDCCTTHLVEGVAIVRVWT